MQPSNVPLHPLLRHSSRFLALGSLAAATLGCNSASPGLQAIATFHAAHANSDDIGAFDPAATYASGTLARHGAASRPHRQGSH